jgi:lipopolysaccharide export system protein LptA
MRFTIERMRTLVLAAGILLVLALVAFLMVSKWRSALNSRDLPQKLGKNIVQEASGVTYTEAHGGHMKFRLHASSAERLQNGHTLLHNVQIKFFSEDGRSVDNITGNNFEYDKSSGVGTAQGPVQITLTRPPEMTANGTGQLPNVPATAGTVDVKTSGVTFNQNTGVLTTAKKVNFTISGGSGSAMGAEYDSQQGYLVLDRAVELTTVRGGRKVILHAAHAEFERDAQTCRLVDAVTAFKAGHASAERAKIFFRKDGTAQKLDATEGFALATNGGGRVTAPEGRLVFGERNQPKSGELRGGVQLNSASAGRQMQGSAPDAQLEFSKTGELSLLTLNQGAEILSNTETGTGTHVLRVNRTWRSPVAQLNFHEVAKGRIEPAELRGAGGVVVTSRTQRGNRAAVPARLTADEVTGHFGPGSELTAIDGTGHANMEQTQADGAKQIAWGDRIDALFAQHAGTIINATSGRDTSEEIRSAVLDGHVVLVQQPIQKPGAQAQPPLRATAEHATYEGPSQQVQLTGNPRVQDGGLNLTANTIDVLQQAGRGYARGDVKATWLAADGEGGRKGSAATPEGLAFGGQTPAHIVAEEAQFSQSGGEAIFRGHARLWQDANSIAAPVILLNREKQRLVANSSLREEPVEAVLIGTGHATAEMAPASQHRKSGAPNTGSMIRVQGGEFTYTEAKHEAVMKGGTLGDVVADTGGAICRSQEVTLLMKPRGSTNQTAEVEQVTARGDVTVSSQGRHGTGTTLVYSGQTGEYALTGTPAETPRLTDPLHGTVTGTALIFSSRDDSVSIEGRGRETRTETTAPKYGRERAN